MAQFDNEASALEMVVRFNLGDGNIDAKAIGVSRVTDYNWDTTQRAFIDKLRDETGKEFFAQFKNQDEVEI